MERNATARHAEEVAGTRSVQSALLLSVVAFSVLVMLWRLLVEPFDHGYIRYASLAAEMVRSGDWIVPRLAGTPYFKKPPLYPWLIAAPMAWTGSSCPWVQHVPSVIAYALSLLWTHLFARRLPGRRGAAFTAGLVLATSIGFFSLAREKRIDSLFAAWLVGCFYFSYRALVDAAPARRRLAWRLAAWGLLALATLTKGPVSVVFFATVVGSFAAWTGRLRSIWSRENLFGVVLFLLLVAVWPALVVHELGSGPTLEILRATRMTARSEGPFYYLDTIGLRLFPWSPFLPAVALWLVAARPYRDSQVLRFVLCWLLGVLVPLHFTEVKHHRYLLPVYPAVALLVVALWQRPAVARARSRATVWLEVLQIGAFGSLFATVLTASVLSPFVAWMHPEWRSSVVGAAAAPVVLAGLLSGFGLRGLLRGGGPGEAAGWLLPAVLLCFAIYDGGRASSFMETDGRRAALAGLESIARGLPARSLHLHEFPKEAVLLATGRSVPSVASAVDLSAWLRREASPQCIVVSDEEGATDFQIAAGVVAGRRERVDLGGSPLVVLTLPGGAAPAPATRWRGR